MNKADVLNKLKKNKIARMLKAAIYPEPYAKFYDKCSIDYELVLYESFYGKGITCNPRAIFEALLERDGEEKYTHIWVYDDKKNWNEWFEKYRDNKNVKFVKIKSRAYYKYLASAGYLINNSTFPACYTKKPGQTYINTWHGIPLKLMGYSMPNGNIEVANTERNFLQADILLSPCESHTDMYLKDYKLQGIYEGRIIETGQARTDTIFKSKPEEVMELLKTQGVSVDPDKKIVLYAPTWKGTDFSHAVADISEFEKIYDEIASGLKDAQLLIRPHQVIYGSVAKSEKLKQYLVPPNIDTNELLCAVDVLISDYSSIFFDYVVTGKPILFYIPDLADYKEARGMYMDIESLPGPATSNLSTICEWLKNPESVISDNYNIIKEQYCKYDDGHVAERIVGTIWYGDNEDVKVLQTSTEKKKLFISLGRILQNGITHSFLSLLNNIDYDKYDVTAYLYEAIAPDQVIRMNQINSNVRVLVRTNYLFATKFELVRLVIGMAFNVKGIFRKILPEKYFIRQAKRMVGDTKFDSVIEFCGYSPILALVLPKMNAKIRAIWMHNDLLADANRKVKNRKPLKRKMEMIFNIYPEWDRLVSCSHSVMEVNKRNLSSPVIEDKFSFARNTINYQRVLDNLEQPCEYTGFELPRAEDTNFVTMGRLSTEKNHGNLVRAFAEYVKEYPNSRLYILGEGPLRQQVTDEIKRLKLENEVILTGNLINPFYLMKQCDCFILPSIYEGQPMVLLEARIVGLPIVVSDFSSVKDSLMENGQYLIKSTEESILDGLKAFSEGRVESCNFDPKEYNKQAVAEFENAVLSE